MESIIGIEIYPIISLVLFFSFFVGLLIWVARTKKEYINHLENLPLED
jgi:hypothetical protein